MIGTLWIQLHAAVRRMNVAGLYLKPRSGAAMVPVATVAGLAGVGLQGDCHAHPESPRQVLVFGRSVLDELRLNAAAVRANVVLDEPVDDLPSGTVLRLGTCVALRLTFACEPCRKLESQRPGLARDLSGRRGVLARVIGSGITRVGEPVAVLGKRCRPLHGAWSDRVLDIVSCLPDGMWLTYSQLARLAGIQTTYCRVFPRLLRRLRIESSLLQAERVVGSKKAGPGSNDVAYWDGASYYANQE